ncbi:hypothetical protein D3C83_202440 [compost metagenome]
MDLVMPLSLEQSCLLVCADPSSIDRQAPPSFGLCQLRSAAANLVGGSVESEIGYACSGNAQAAST